MKTARKPGRKRARQRAAPLPPTLPVVTPENILQARSRTIFEEAVSPWLVTQWTSHDYGMDAIAEVLKPRDDGNTGYFDTGRRIGLQLKASESAPSGGHAAVQVHVRTLRYWLASHDPFALVFCHVPTRRVVYRWVDDDLIAELGARETSWFTKESVTIHVPWEKVLSSERLDDFDREARHVVVHRHRVLAPGTYDRLVEEAHSTMEAVLRSARGAGFESVVTQLTAVEERVRNATYIVALAGRMRAGKSTLFNALVRRDVSPVARRPTTAVPVLATAGASDQGTVAFLDGKTLVIAATSDALAEYATQDQNPDNQKGVRLITVRLVSERLERGIAILDAPGLFDPSEELRTITARAIAQANAVLFVVDVSSARSGGFAVESHVLDELKRVLDHSDRVFLLLNKADELADADREDVLATLGRALGRDKLGDRLAGPPAFVSARKAWEWAASGGESESPLSELEAQVWDYLLRSNATGVVRLETAVRESSRAIDDALKFIACRRASSEQARVLHERLRAAHRKISDLRAYCASVRERAFSAAAVRMDSGMGTVPAKMGAAMRATGAVPSRDEIAKQLNGHLATIFGEIWRIAQRELELHGHEVSERLEAALDQVRLDHEPTQHPVIVAPSIAIPQVNLIAPEALGFGALGWLVTLAFAPAHALVAAIGSFLVGAWWRREKQLAREIEKVERKIGDHIRSLVKPARDLLEGIRVGHERLDRHVADRWAVFEKDVKTQLSTAGTELSQDERNALANLEAELLAAQHRLGFIAEEIRWTPEPQRAAPATSNAAVAHQEKER